MEKTKPERKYATRYVFSDELKRDIIEEYIETGSSKASIQAKYGIKSKCGIQKWMRKLGYADLNSKDSTSLSKNIGEDMTKKNSNNNSLETKEALEKRIGQLERQLEDEKLRSEAYKRMIEITEKELKISIRKKGNTK